MKLKNKIILIALCLILVNVMLFKIPLDLNKVCAADTFLTSSACVTNYVTCDPGYKNFQQMIDEEDYTLQGTLTRDDMLTAFGSLGGKDLRTICLPQGINHFIPAIENADSYDSKIHGEKLGDTGPGLIMRGVVFISASIASAGNPIFGFFFQDALPDDGRLIIRACPPNWIGQQMVGIQTYGCCPQGFKYVGGIGSATKIGNLQGSDVNGSACCRNNSAVEGTPIGTKGFEKECFTDSATNPDFTIPFANPSASTFAEFEEELSSGNISNFTGFSSSTGIGGSSTPTKYIILGLNMGENYIDAEIGGLTRLMKKESLGAIKVCPPVLGTTGCAVDGTNASVPSDKFNNIGGMDPTSNEASCKYCYANGEPMRVREENDEKNLELCIGTNGVPPQGSRNASSVSVWVELINGNIYDTLAYYRADESNRDTLLTCRERGGIYVAIGCIDPTPVGILTGLIRLAFGVVGGVALIQLILAGVAYQSGNEERIQESKKKIFATLGGLAVLVFSVLILRIIGVNVLDVLPIGAI